MRLELEINNRAKICLNGKIIRRAVLEALKKSELVFLSGKKISISLAAVSSAEIKKINRIYRQKEETTDILSFSEYKNAISLKKEKKSVIFLGEMVVCFENIRNYAKRAKLDFEKELAKTIAHGTLHLLGFAHGKKMFKIQNSVSCRKGRQHSANY